METSASNWIARIEPARIAKLCECWQVEVIADPPSHFGAALMVGILESFDQLD
jgi:hypothetical protein